MRLAEDVGSILIQEGDLQYEITTHTSILAWEIPQTEETGKLQPLELQKVRHN